MGGSARFGPNVEWVESLDYNVNPANKDIFADAILPYFPGLIKDKLQADYAGIRPKIVLDDNIYTDFLISLPSQHGIKGLVNLFGIESPGLTASLAIAKSVVASL